MLLVLVSPSLAILLDRQRSVVVSLLPRTEPFLAILKLSAIELLFGLVFSMGLIGLLNGYTTFDQVHAGALPRLPPGGCRWR